MEKEIDKKTEEAIVEIINFNKEGDHYKKEVSLIWDGKQFSIKIPKKITEEAHIKKEDTFRFHLIPKDRGFSVEAELIRK